MFTLHKGACMRGDRVLQELEGFTLLPGEAMLIEGKNGGGKSSFLQAIAGLPGVSYTGDIVLENGLLSACEPHERFARGCMMIFQDPPPLSGISVTTLVREMLAARTGSRPEIAEVYRMVRDAYDRVGLSYDMIERPLFVGFSGGEKKRVELALLLLARPKVILFDEGDAGLDVLGRGIAQEILRDCLTAGSVLLCVTHHAEFFEEIFGREHGGRLRFTPKE